MSWTCFLLEPAGESLRWLRRYASGPCPLRPGEYGYHDASAFLDRAPSVDSVEYAPADDSRWPTACGCGFVFAPPTESQRQLFSLHLWRRADGQPGEYVIHGNPYAPAVKAPVGAMWFADWLSEFSHGPDGRCLVVRCPGDHDWTVDGRASNRTETCVNCGRAYHEHFDAKGYTSDRCTGGYQPRDGGAHRCWVRHGTPPNVTVNKNGLTCKAGGGSIQVPGWHGFLTNGVLHP